MEVEDEPSKLVVFCISKKQLKSYQLNFTVGNGMFFRHVGNSIYLGGGELNEECFANFRKISRNGEETELQKMLNPKFGSAIALWKERSTLYVLGGYNTSFLK